jgi:glycosyltransferase involved in cell wall biosynthesis
MMSSSGAPDEAAQRPLRIAIVYDCLYPHTIGGCERWYRAVAARLAARHRVSYLTRVQWDPGAAPDAPAGVEVIGLDGGRQLYTASGRRRIAPPLRFGLAVLLHLIRNRNRYDIVHSCSFPYFPLIAARAACAAGGPALVADWVEVWPREYWRAYLGTAGGATGAAVQKLCITLTGPCFTLSELAASMLREQGYRGRPVVLKGIYDGPIPPPPAPAPRPPLAVFAGRHIPDKQVGVIPGAIAIARKRIPDLKGVIFGDGPQRPQVLSEIARLQLEDVVQCPGFAPWDAIDSALGEATCMLLPSRREGYGLIVVEAAARGTPSIVVDGSDNAATSLVINGINGFVAASADPAALADAIVKSHTAGPPLIQTTYGWFREHAQELSVDSSVAEIERLYRSLAGGA